MKKKYVKNFIAISVVVSIIAMIMSLVIYISNATSGQKAINGTNFVNEQIPIDGSENFAVDSKENIYFSSGTLLQVYNIDGYLYSLKLPINSSSFWVAISEDDIINIYLYRSDNILRYNQKGELVEETNINDFPKHDFDHSRYVRNNSVYLSSGGGSFTYDVITRSNDKGEIVVFHIPEWQLAYRYVLLVFWASLIAIVVLIGIYFILKNSDNRKGFPKQIKIGMDH